MESLGMFRRTFKGIRIWPTQSGRKLQVVCPIKLGVRTLTVDFLTNEWLSCPYRAISLNEVKFLREESELRKGMEMHFGVL